MRARRRRSLAAAALAALACVPAGCGGSNTLTAAQLESRATKICDAARVKMGRIATPALPADEQAFLSAGVAVLQPELKALGKLAPPGGSAEQYRRARAALSSQLVVMQAAVARLHAGADPLVEITRLEQRLEPVEAGANTAWNTLGIPACADH
jgi:hypothetical protein